MPDADPTTRRDAEAEEYYDEDEIVTVEATGRTLEEAVRNALDELGLEEDEVEIEVLSEGSKGVLGIGAEEARVRVTSLPYEDEEYEEAEGEDEGDEVAPPGNRRFAGAMAVTRPAEEEARPREIQPAAEPFATIAQQTLAEILERMGMEADVYLDAAEMDEDLPSIELSVSGEYMGILIGRHGDTLSALQFLLGLLVSRKADRRVRVVIDVEGYRERRARLLRDMAHRAAERAQRYREPVFMDPMIPSERRIVHMTLADHPYVSTHSVGEGDGRRVVVEPKHR